MPSRWVRNAPRLLPAGYRQTLEPLLAEVESLTQRIRDCDRRIEQIAREEYPETALLKQVSGVGTLIALTFVLTLEDRRRFGRSRDVGCYVGLRPKRSCSGNRDPQLRISKEGDPYLRTLLVQGAHHILGWRGPDTDLRRWGLKLAERGGKNAKKRAVVAVARKLAILLHQPVGERRGVRATTAQPGPGAWRASSVGDGKVLVRQANRRVRVTARSR